MKRTRITYTATTDDRILIRKIENVADSYEIRHQFGGEVMRLYEEGPHYYREYEGCIFYTNPRITNDEFHFKEGQVLKKSEFWTRYGALVKASDCLSSLGDSYPTKKIYV